MNPALFASLESFLGWSCLLFSGLVAGSLWGLGKLVESISQSEVASGVAGEVAKEVATEVARSWIEDLLQSWFG